MATIFDVNLRLRRDNEYNYARVGKTFIPLNGEPCLIDTGRQGLRIKIGDGKTPFEELDYADNFLIIGYLSNGGFYKDKNYQTVYTPYTNRVYLDAITNEFYYYTGAKFQKVGATITAATASTPGIMKLYSTVGDNTDGTMTQKAITDELDDKVELALDMDEELLIFKYD